MWLQTHRACADSVGHWGCLQGGLWAGTLSFGAEQQAAHQRSTQPVGWELRIEEPCLAVRSRASPLPLRMICTRRHLRPLTSRILLTMQAAVVVALAAGGRYRAGVAIHGARRQVAAAVAAEAAAADLAGGELAAAARQLALGMRCLQQAAAGGKVQALASAAVEASPAVAAAAEAVSSAADTPAVQAAAVGPCVAPQVAPSQDIVQAAARAKLEAAAGLIEEGVPRSPRTRRPARVNSSTLPTPLQTLQLVRTRTHLNPVCAAKRAERSDCAGGECPGAAGPGAGAALARLRGRDR